MAKRFQPDPTPQTSIPAAEIAAAAHTWANASKPMAPVNSPHVFHLLQNIASRTRETELALAALAVDTVKRYASVYSTFETSQGPAFVLTRDQVRQFLLDAGIEEWGRAVWLSVDPDTLVLKADIRLNHGIRQQPSVIDTVAKAALMTLQIGRSVTSDSINGVDYFGFRAVALFDLLQAAHSIVKSDANWIDPPNPSQRPRQSP